MAEQIEIDIVANDKTSGIIQGIFQGIGQSLANFALQIPGAILNFGKDIMNEAMEAELALTDLRATLESTGGAAGMTEKQLTDMADSLSQVTRFSDDAILSGENMLLTFTNIGADVFPQATEALLDLATKMKSDLPTAAIQLGKALNDPIQGVTALRRVGVQLSEQQEQQIKDFMAVGDIASAQKIILEELNKEFGGQAEAAGQTFAGAMDILKNRIDNVKESIGMALIPVLTDLMDKFIIPLLPYIEGLADRFAKWLSGMGETGGIDGLINTVSNVLLPVLHILSQWWEDNGKNIIEVAVGMGDKIAEGAQKAAQWIDENLVPILWQLHNWWMINGVEIVIKAQEIGEAIANFVMMVWTEHLQPFIEEQLPKLKAWWEENGPRIIEIAKQMGVNFQTNIGYMVEILDILLPLLDGFIDLVLGLSQALLQISTGDWEDAWGTIKTSFVSAVDDIYMAFNRLVELINKLTGLPKEFLSFGGVTAGNMFTGQGANFANFGAASIGSSFNLGTNAFDLGAELANRIQDHRASGGPVSAGNPYIVGERGPEMFVPGQSGNIIPNGGGAVNVTLNYSPAVSLGNRQEAEQTLIPYIIQGIRQAQANGLVSVA